MYWVLITPARINSYSYFIRKSYKYQFKDFLILEEEFYPLKMFGLGPESELVLFA